MNRRVFFAGCAALLADPAAAARAPRATWNVIWTSPKRSIECTILRDTRDLHSCLVRAQGYVTAPTCRYRLGR